MNISRLNFGDKLSTVIACIRQAHYLAVDLEMSGIVGDDLTNASISDSMQQRYTKQKHSIRQYIPLQLGLTTFRVEAERERIVAHPFNFYIFPLGVGGERPFAFRPSTMHFLTQHHFDFNALFYSALPYANSTALKQAQHQEQQLELRREMVRLRKVEAPQSRAFYKMHSTTVQKWLQSQEETLTLSIELVRAQAYLTFAAKIQEEHPERHLTFEYDSQQLSQRTQMTIRKTTPPQKPLQGEPSSPPLLFNRVFEEMLKSRKPLIVHNGYLDLMHMYYRLYDELPELWSDYRQQLHGVFPLIYDNKHLFSDSPTLLHKTTNRNTSLEHCFTAMKEHTADSRVRFEIAPQCSEYSLDSLESHEAGFDALMTGYSFLRGSLLLNNDIEALKSPVLTADRLKLVRNRLPQGAIKVPLNLQEQEEDIYVKDGATPFFLQSLLGSTQSAESITQQLKQRYGAVNVLWNNSKNTQFCLFFISQKEHQAFERSLEDRKVAQGCWSLHISGVDYLVFSQQQHQKRVDNQIKHDTLESTEM